MFGIGKNPANSKNRLEELQREKRFRHIVNDCFPKGWEAFENAFAADPSVAVYRLMAGLKDKDQISLVDEVVKACWLKLSEENQIEIVELLFSSTLRLERAIGKFGMNAGDLIEQDYEESEARARALMHEYVDRSGG